jgi:hypothetical protein
MYLRPVPFFVLGITAASIVACGSGHQNLFSGSTGSGGSSSSGTGGSGAGGGTAETTGTGGTASTGGGATTTSTTKGSTSSSSGTTTTSSSSTSTSSTSSSSSGSGTTYPAPFPPPPQVVSGGGPVMTAPQIYPVFFSNDDAATVASLTDFTMSIGGTAYWTAATSEYGVGPATGHAAIKLAETSTGTIDDAAIQQWLAARFAGNYGFPTPNANTLIVLYYPSGTTITLQGNTSCQVFGGYHQSARVGGQQVAYAVVPRCGNLDSTTGDASHEMVEAVTDPRPQVDPAYVQVDESDLVWQLVLGGGEVGDMCAQFAGVFTKFPPFNYTVQRTWSNQAALAGHDPCVPVPAGEVYFNAALVLPDTGTLNVQGQSAMIKSVKIPVGGSKTIPVQLFSDGPTGPWTVTPYDLGQLLGSTSPLLDLTLSPTTGKNGDVLQLTIKVIAAGQGNLEPFFVKSVNGNQHADWFGAVTN